jgi:hypothetical protein
MNNVKMLKRAGRLACACLGLFAVSSTGASAQQGECFAVMMTNATGGGNLGSILVDKCTGNTWVLGRVNLANGGSTIRWFPISVEKTEGRSQ